ncbi:MAG: DNA repair protein RecN [Syntrophomonadaceae bacterium]
MLQEIYIKNFVLIEELRLEFCSGFNVLTGETGAGKSIIIDALGLVMGDRISSDLVRNPAQRAIAEAVFSLDEDQTSRHSLLEAGLIDETDDSVIITREISPQGRSTARINGKNISVSALRELAARLLDLHLQHDHLTLLRPEMYTSYIDSFIEQGPLLLQNLGQAFKIWTDLKGRLQDLCSEEQNRLQMLDFLSYQIKEIEQADLKPGEEEEHRALRERIRNSGKLADGASQMLMLLYEGEQQASALDQIASALDVVHTLGQDPFFASLLSSMEEAYYTIQDLAIRLGSFRESLDFEPGLLDVLEERLHHIERLKARYGKDIQEVLTYLAKSREEYERLGNSQEEKQNIEQELLKAQGEYENWAGLISSARREAAAVLQEQVNRELKELNLPHTQFQVQIGRHPKPTAMGWDKFDFMFCANPGEEMRPLARVASGGELSRVVLALKKALAAVYNLPTLIFDEIDVGVGGTSLAAMARKLGELAERHQVILVTHSPQVAAYAGRHFLIEKQQKPNFTLVHVHILDREGRIRELARMLGGENYSELTLQHAREMLTETESQAS